MIDRHLHWFCISKTHVFSHRLPSTVISLKYVAANLQTAPSIINIISTKIIISVHYIVIFSILKTQKTYKSIAFKHESIILYTVSWPSSILCHLWQHWPEILRYGAILQASLRIRPEILRNRAILQAPLWILGRRKKPTN